MDKLYAIVASGGKQYRVRPGQVINTELLPAEKGQQVELQPVLMISDGNEVVIGSPQVEGARVLATCLEQGKSRKVIVFRYKNKVRSRRKTGHRQPYTRLLIKQIVRPPSSGTSRGGDN